MKRSCPMCSALEYESRFFIEKSHRQYEIVGCLRCGFVFVANPQQSTFGSREKPPRTIVRKHRHVQIKRLCDSHLLGAHGGHSKLQIVEVGAGWGGLAEAFAADDQYHYTGFEPNLTRAAFCRARGLNVRSEMFDPSPSASNAHAVVIDNVLEHVDAPRDLVRAAVASLVPRGLLIVIVPNLDDVRRIYRPWRTRHHWQPHCHINYFSARDLKRLFEAYDLELRFFGFQCARWSDVSVIPRIVMDGMGLHPFGLNCYGVK